MFSPVLELLCRVFGRGRSTRRVERIRSSSDGPKRKSARWVRQNYRMYRSLWNAD